MPLKPYLEPNVLSRPIVHNRRNDFITAQTSRNIQTFLSLARTLHDNTLTTRRTRTFPDNMTLYSALVNVYKRSIARQFRYLGVISYSFLLIAFTVGYCCFFKVIFSRSSASNAPDAEPLNSFAISANVASGFSAM